MQYVSYSKGNIRSWGRLDGDAIIDHGAHAIDLKTAIAAGLLGKRLDGTELRLADVQLEPPISNPGKIFCVGHNYESHRVETARDKTDHPSIFTRFADTLVGHGAPIVRPRVSSDLDYEAELAVVIGKGGRAIAVEEAMDHVAGYSCFNDVSVRDWQWHTRQFIPGKNFPGTGAFGPALVTPDELGDPQTVAVECVVNGTVMQCATLDHMLFSIPVVIAYIRQFTPLSAGDVIATGTPGGVGAKRNPPVWLKPGDTVEVRVSTVGSLSNPVVQE